MGQSVRDAGQKDNAGISKFQIDLHLLSSIKNSGPSVNAVGVIRDNGIAYLSERTDKTYWQKHYPGAKSNVAGRK